MKNYSENTSNTINEKLAIDLHTTREPWKIGFKFRKKKEKKIKKAKS